MRKILSAIMSAARPARHQIIVLDPVTWNVQKAGDCWVGECDALGLTVESATWAELMEDIAAVLDAMFHDLWSTGDLERFLRDRKLTAYGLASEPEAPPLHTGNPVFDIPFLPALNASEGSTAPAYR